MLGAPSQISCRFHVKFNIAVGLLSKKQESINNLMVARLNVKRKSAKSEIYCLLPFKSSRFCCFVCTTFIIYFQKYGDSIERIHLHGYRNVFRCFTVLMGGWQIFDTFALSFKEFSYIKTQLSTIYKTISKLLVQLIECNRQKKKTVSFFRR